jgi:hypothetical protein
MSTYKCSECGATAIVFEGFIIRDCEHDAPVIAELEASVRGTGGVS